ncbi:hypothetical protein RKLH11_3884 [Rhodobacteraceae bacterium KLH11]|nr:hypothetical protein RKLH11_3884 [Rhodobacteraceae bacterium KLH11]
MHLLELADGDLGVNLRGVEFGMSQKLLDVTDISPVLQHQCRTAMAEQVAGAALAGLGRADVTPHKLGHAIRGPRLVKKKAGSWPVRSN